MPARELLKDADASYLEPAPRRLPPDTRVRALRDALAPYTFAHVDASLLGTLYEALVESPRAHGRFYSQPPVTKLVFEAIRPSPSQGRCVGIADLSCGSGSFLVAGSNWLGKHRLRGRLLGKDLSDTAVALARLTLHLLCPGSAGNAELVKGNGLIPRDGPTYSDIQIVVGNPPFGRYPRHTDPREIRRLRRDYKFFQMRQERSLLFVEQALSIVPDGGWLGIVLPEAKLTNPGGAAFRRRLFDTCSIKRIAFLPLHAFRSGYPTAVVVARKESETERRQENVIEFLRFEADAGLREMEAGHFAIRSEVAQRVWAANPEAPPPLFTGTPLGPFLPQPRRQTRIQNHPGELIRADRSAHPH